MKKLFLLVILFALAFFAVSCQPTPKENTIVNKQNLEEKIQNNSNAASNTEDKGTNDNTKNTENATVVRDQWKYDNGISVSMNAEFIKPDTFDLPVVQIKTREFTRDEIDRVIQHFFTGRTMYKPWAESKEDIAKKIVKLKQIISSPASTEDDVGMAQAMLSSAQAEYDKAPEAVNKEPASTDFIQIDPSKTVNGEYIDPIKDPVFDSLKIWADKADGRSVLTAVNAKDGANSWLQYVDKVDPDTYHEFEINLVKDGSIGIEYDDAKKIAIDFIKKMGLELDLADSDLLSRIYTIGDPNKIKQTDIDASKYKSYQFWFTRSVNGVPITFDSTTPGGDQNEYDASTYYEMASVTVDKNGISEFQYRAPYQIEKIAEESANIIDINKATELFKKHLKDTFAAATDKDIKTIDVNKIVLGLSRTKTNDGGFLLVPTYDFFANIEHSKGSEISVESFSSAFSLCTINAIDGSIINKNLGY
jgi:hypothetical protein